MSSHVITQVLGLDTIRTRDVRETHKLVVKHIAGIRKIRNLEDCTIVLCLESNLAFEAQHIIHTLQEAGLRKWVALQEGTGHSLGWLTTNERKEAMCFQLRDALKVGNIALSTQFFSTNCTDAESLQQLDGELVSSSLHICPCIHRE
jgi:hypothetical protein